MVNLAHSASLQLCEKTAPAKAGIKQLARFGIKVFVLHDLDVKGLNIAHTLGSSNERYRFENSLDIVDMGVRLVDAEALGLQSEPFKLDQNEARLRETLARHGATPAEIAMLVDRKRRIEIDAMTPAQLVEFIERKLTEHGIRKIVPIEDAMEPYYLRKVSEIRIERELEPLRAELEQRIADEGQRMRADGVLRIDMPPMVDRVRSWLETNPNQSWIEAVEALAQQDELWTG